MNTSTANTGTISADYNFRNRITSDVNFTPIDNPNFQGFGAPTAGFGATSQPAATSGLFAKPMAGFGATATTSSGFPFNSTTTTSNPFGANTQAKPFGGMFISLLIYSKPLYFDFE